MSYANCQSCGMPLESGTYCQHCQDASGNLQSFDERIHRMSQFIRSQDQSLSDADARAKAKAHMAQMPAWKDHPGIKA